MSTPDRVQRMLEAGHLQENSASDGDVATMWHKALVSTSDARNPANSLDNQYVLGYQALLQMCTAVLACAGYRTRGAQGHHANTFYAVGSLQIAGMEDINIDMERIRQMRKVSAYEPGSPTPVQLARLFELIDAVMPAAQRWLAEQRPNTTFKPYSR
jgi:hypothetical protein